MTTATVAMDPLDPGLRVVERRDELAVAERPVRTAEARIGGADDDADRDEPESGREGRARRASGSGSRDAPFYRRRRRRPGRSAVRCSARCTHPRPRSLATLCAVASGRRLLVGRRVASRPRHLRSAGAVRRSVPPRRRPSGRPRRVGLPATQRPRSSRSSSTNAVAMRQGPDPVRSTSTPQNRVVSAPDRTATVAFYDLGTRPDHSRSPPPTARSSGRSRTSAGCTSSTWTCPRPGPGAPSSRPRRPGSPAETVRLHLRRSATPTPTVQVGEAAPASKTPTAGRRRRRPVEDLDRREAGPGLLPDLGRRRARRAQAVHARSSRRPKFCTSSQCGPDARPVQADRRGEPGRHVHQRRALPARGRRRRSSSRSSTRTTSLQATDVTDEWGLLSEPWIFAVDRMGSSAARTR